MAYSTETDKIDKKATDGLEGTADSLAYRVHELERHFHNTEKWFGMALVPVGETHVADRMSVSNSPFTLTAGNDDFGSWVQLLGSEDTPVIAGAVKFDAHNVLIVTTNSTNVL